MDQNAGADRPDEQILHAIDEPRHVDRLGPKLLASGEGKEPLSQSRSALGPLYRRVDQARGARIIVGQALLQQFQTPQHRHEEVVEVMGDAAGQLPDRFHFLGFKQLGERGLALLRALVDSLFQLLVELAKLARRGLERSRALPDARFQVVVDPLQLAGFAMKLRKDAAFRTEQLRNHRDRHVIDGTRFVAAQPIDIGDLDRRHEDDRDFSIPRMVAYQSRQFEAVEFGHADIDQDERDVRLEKHAQRFARRACLDEVLAEITKDHFVAEEFARLIVDEKNIDLILQRGGACHRWSHIRRAERSWSVLTGFAR